MTTLDLNGYDSLVYRSRIKEPVGVRMVAVGIGLIFIIIWLALTVFLTDGFFKYIYPFGIGTIHVSVALKTIVLAIGATILTAALVLIVSGFLVDYFLNGSKENEHSPSFREYVDKAYGIRFSGLPDDKPCDGSIRVVWKKNGHVHSGIVNIMDNELSIKELAGDYLEVIEQAAQKNGE